MYSLDLAKARFGLESIRPHLIYTVSPHYIVTGVRFYNSNRRIIIEIKSYQ